MKDIFVTSTFRNDWNREFNLKLAEMLEASGFTVHLPQRDSEQLGDNKKTFLADIAGIDDSKLILAIGAKTQTSNWGFEIGYAYKSNKPIIILTDKDHPPELMTSGAAKKVIEVANLDDTKLYLEDLIQQIKNLIN